MKLSRLGRVGAGVMSASLALATITACGGSSGSNDSPPGKVSVTTKVSAPKGEVDSINWTLPNEPNTLDPAQSALENVSSVIGNICEQLMVFGPNYSIEPSLAEKVSQPNDKTYVFDLRPGVKFWDGSEVTAEDVIYSMERVIDPDVASAWASAFTNLESIEKTGPLQVTVKFTKPSVMFRWFEATPAVGVVKKDFAEKAGKKFGTASGGVMCTGPYKVKSWRSGQDLTITRNDDYWGDKPLVKDVRFTFDAEASSSTAALLRGDADGQWNNSVSSLKRLSSSDSGSVLYGQSLSPVFVSGFVKDPAMSIPQVRQALQKLVDYNGVAKSVYGGAAVPIKTLTPPNTWGYSKDIFQAAYDTYPDQKQDLEGARKLIKEAGDVPPLEIAYDNSAKEESKIALALQSAAEQVGLTIKLRSLSPGDYSKIFYEEKAREGLGAYIVRGYLDFPEPLSYDLYRTKGSYYNYTGYDNDEYDRLLHQAEVTLDDDERAKLVTKAEKIYADGSPYGMAMVSPYINVFVSKRLTGLVPEQSFLYTPWAASLGSAK